MIDLHTHSTVSDGEFSPEQLVGMAKEAKLSVFAVSDHDSLEGSRRAIKYGQETGVVVVPAVEISASLLGKVVHVLGYYVDLENKALEASLREICDYRISRAKFLVEHTNAELAALGKEPMSLERVLDLGKEKPITRSDIAQYLVELGHVQSKQEAFDRWLEKYNIPNKDLSAEEAIKLVHGAGGVAVLAHPHSKFLSLWAINPDPAEIAKLLSELKEQGLDGVEAYRTEHTPEDQERYMQLADSLGLIPCGGSDFHGPSNSSSPDRIAAIDVPDTVAERLSALKELRK